jgi:hypothetical protein
LWCSKSAPNCIVPLQIKFLELSGTEKKALHEAKDITVYGTSLTRLWPPPSESESEHRDPTKTHGVLVHWQRYLLRIESSALTSTSPETMVTVRLGPPARRASTLSAAGGPARARSRNLNNHYADGRSPMDSEPSALSPSTSRD